MKLPESSLKEIYDKNSNALLYGDGERSGYPVSEIMQAIAYIIADERKLYGKRAKKFYEVIQSHISYDKDLSVEVRKPEMQLTSNFLAERKKELSVFWGIGELKTNLKKIIDANPEKCYCALPFALNVPILNLDIFALITDGTRFELLILEVKRMNNAGLKEWSQLVGYCMISGAKYGLLVNIDHGASSRLSQILSSEEHIPHVRKFIDNKVV